VVAPVAVSAASIYVSHCVDQLLKYSLEADRGAFIVTVEHDAQRAQWVDAEDGHRVSGKDP
jgi:hypothetical protein